MDFYNNMSSLNELYEIHLRLLLITIAKGGYPHEIICFIYNNLLISQNLTPAKIYEHKSKIKLIHLCDEQCKLYYLESEIPDETIKTIFDTFKYILIFNTVEENIFIKPGDKKAKKRLKKIYKMPVGKTTLNDYFGSNPLNNIYDWVYRVLKNVKQEMINWEKKPYMELLNYCHKNLKNLR